MASKCPPPAQFFNGAVLNQAQHWTARTTAGCAHSRRSKQLRREKDQSDMITSIISKYYKLIIKLGAILGVSTAMLGIYREITKPAPPNLKVDFVINNSDKLYLGINKKDEETLTNLTLLPIQIKVTNIGKQIANKVTINLASKTPKGIEFMVDETEPQAMFDTNGNIQYLYKLELGSINPGEPVFTSKKIYVRFIDLEGLSKMGQGISIEAKDGSIYKLADFDWTVHAELKATIYSENAKENSNILTVKIANTRYFRRHKNSYLLVEAHKINNSKITDIKYIAYTSFGSKYEPKHELELKNKW